jgi:hypothetical protein
LRLNKTNKKDGHMGEAEFAIVGERDHSLAVGPVLLGERIVSLDVLRGIAVLGILVMNIYAFAMPFIAYANPLAMGGNELHNIGTWFFTHIFFDQKFLSIFAMLFGAGVILMTGRAESRGGKYGRIFYRRQFWLIVIGAVHGYLIWFGDILFTYAVIGMLVFLVRKRRPKTLIIIRSKRNCSMTGNSFGRSWHQQMRTCRRTWRLTKGATRRSSRIVRQLSLPCRYSRLCSLGFHASPR